LAEGHSINLGAGSLNHESIRNSEPASRRETALDSAGQTSVDHDLNFEPSIL
jgi:hypothetical protein